MVAFHQDDYVETYLLTIMNMVSSLYKDPAIGNFIKVVVVRIVLLEEDESHPDFNVTHVAENNLQNFCRYDYGGLYYVIYNRGFVAYIELFCFQMAAIGKSEK